MQPRGANAGAAMIAHCAEHPWLQIAKGHVVGEPANVQFGVVMTVWIAANDKHRFSTVGPHVGQRHGLVVKYEVRDCPRHAALKRGRTDKHTRSSTALLHRALAQPVQD